MGEPSKIGMKISAAKKNCLMCFSYKGFQGERSERNREDALYAMQALYTVFEQEQNTLRRKDAALPEIRKAERNKRICLDAKEACELCKKDMDRINRMASSIER